MSKVVITVLGQDRPGLVAEVSAVLAEHGFNIEDVSQTLAQSQFAGIFIASVPAGEMAEEAGLRLDASFATRFAGQPLHVWRYPLENGQGPAAGHAASEPFVITSQGPDRVGLIAGLAGVLAAHGANIVNLKAAFQGDDHTRMRMIFEADVPSAVDRRAFRDALYAKARELGHDLSLQHRNIFEIIHHV